MTTTKTLSVNLIPIKTTYGITFIDPMNILFCEVEGKKTTIYLNSNECIESFHSLKEFEEKFSNFPLVRCHAKYMVNISYSITYNPKTREIELINKRKIAVAKDRKALFIKTIRGERVH